VPHQIANIHTAFNVVTTLVLFPLIGFFEKTVTKLFPGQDITIQKNAVHLDQHLIQTPALALEQVKKEIARITRITHTMLNLSFERFEKRDLIIEKKILDRESAVDSVTEDIIRYLTKVSQKTLGLRLSNQLTNLLHIAYDIERTGDHAESILYLIRVKEENNMVFSKIEEEELKRGFDQVKYMFKTLSVGIEDDSTSKLRHCEKVEAEIDEIVKEVRTNHLTRLRNGECPPHSGVIFADIFLHLERMGDLLYAISRNFLNIKEYKV
jgi:phosphate:Na+ symporter